MFVLLQIFRIVDRLIVDVEVLSAVDGNSTRMFDDGFRRHLICRLDVEDVLFDHAQIAVARTVDETMMPGLAAVDPTLQVLSEVASSNSVAFAQAMIAESVEPDELVPLAELHF